MRHLFLSAFLAGLCCFLAGCGRSQDVPPPTTNPSHEGRRATAALADTTSTRASTEPKAAADLAPSSSLPLYQLKMEPRDLVALERDPHSNQTYPATFTADDGQVYPGVAVRFRGEWARSWPKKPLKIFFDRNQPFQGHHSVNLNSAWRDPAFVREALAYHVYARCGVPASRSRMIRLDVNGSFRGLYVEVEQVDKPFLRRFQLRGAGLYKASSDQNMADERDLGSLRSFARHYQNESDPTNSLQQLQEFCRALNAATNVSEFFAQQIEVDTYINYLAGSVLVQHWDGLNKNHFLVHDVRGGQKWLALPWDLDRTFGDHWHGSFDHAKLSIVLGTRQRPSVTGWNRLQDRLWNEPTLRDRFLDRLDVLLRTEFTREKLFPWLDQHEAMLAPVAALDRRLWPGTDEDLHRGIAGLKRFIEQRRAFLIQELARLRPQAAGQ